MSAHLEDFLKSGRKILDDTKTPALPKKKGEKVKALGTEGPQETDPHKILIRRTIQEKPKKKELIEEFQKFITAAEAMI
tara:strand:+ start:1669 stop:1905 length:237 start_codon:yes stop_codon:yes gene_type:complete